MKKNRIILFMLLFLVTALLVFLTYSETRHYEKANVITHLNSDCESIRITSDKDCYVTILVTLTSNSGQMNFEYCCDITADGPTYIGIDNFSQKIVYDEKNQKAVKLEDLTEYKISDFTIVKLEKPSSYFITRSFLLVSILVLGLVLVCMKHKKKT